MYAKEEIAKWFFCFPISAWWKSIFLCAESCVCVCSHACVAVCTNCEHILFCSSSQRQRQKTNNRQKESNALSKRPLLFSVSSLYVYNTHAESQAEQIHHLINSNLYNVWVYVCISIEHTNVEQHKDIDFFFEKGKKYELNDIYTQMAQKARTNERANNNK